MTLPLVLSPKAEEDLQEATDRIEVLAVWHERRHPDGWKARAEVGPHSR